MVQKYCYVNEKILKQSSLPPRLNLTDFFLGLRAGFLFMIVFFLGYFFIKEPAYTAKIRSPISMIAAMETSVNGQVAGASSVILTPTVIPTDNPSPQPTQPAAILPTSTPASPAPTTIKLGKNSYSIAIIGDSMVDTMGERLEYLEHALKKKYPQTSFTLYNFGKGAQNVVDGLARFHDRLDYQDRHYPSLDEIKPDVLIVGSFAYNPLSPHDPGRYQSTLSQFVNEAKTISGRVYILAEIAPLKVGFGKGPGGINWDDDTSYQQATKIIEQLENAIGVSQSLNVPMIDVFTPSQVAADKSGNPKFVNANDGIHPSVAGHEFMADIIANRIQF